MSFTHVRHLIAFVSFFALAAIYANQIIINFTFICMTKDVNDTILVNGELRQRYDYTTQEKSWLISIAAIGTLLATFPVTHLFARYGARHLFFAFGLLSCVLTLFLPWAASQGYWTLMAFRLLQGLSLATDFTTIGMVCVDWAPIDEFSTFVGLLSVFAILSTIFTNPISAWFCEAEGFGWQWSFYAHATAGIIFMTVWWLLYRDDPAQHFAVTKEELRVIHRNKTAAHIDTSNRGDVPYLKMITNPTILVCWVAAFLEITSGVIVYIYAPLYFNKVLDYDVHTTGLLVSIMGIVQIPAKTMFCLTSDHMRCVSERTKMLFFNFLAFVVCGVVYASIGLTPYREISVFLFCCVSALCSATCGSFYKCVSFVARQHAHFAISSIQFTKCISLFAAPAIVGFLVHTDDDTVGWNTIFIGFGVILILLHFAFWAVVTEEAAEWTEEKKEVKVEMKTALC